MIEALRFVVSAGIVVVFAAALGLAVLGWLASAIAARASATRDVIRIKSGRASTRRVIVRDLFHVKQRSGAGFLAPRSGWSLPSGATRPVGPTASGTPR